jgi:hypothetical protein
VNHIDGILFFYLLKFIFKIACDKYVTEGDSLSVVPTATLCTPVSRRMKTPNVVKLV